MQTVVLSRTSQKKNKLYNVHYNTLRNSAYPYISKCVHYTLQRHVLPMCINDNETFQEGRCGELFPNRSIVSSNTIKSSRSFINKITLPFLHSYWFVTGTDSIVIYILRNSSCFTIDLK